METSAVPAIVGCRLSLPPRFHPDVPARRLRHVQASLSVLLPYRRLRSRRDSRRQPVAGLPCVARLKQLQSNVRDEWDEAKNRSNHRGDGSCPTRARGDAHDPLEKGEPK